MKGFIFICVFCFSYFAHAEIYTWRDERGILHFGDKPIDGIEQSKVELEAHNSQWQKYVIDIQDPDSVLSPEESKRISKDVNVIYEFYDRKLFFDIYKTVPVSIHLFAEQSGYQRYLASLGYSDKGNSRGKYLPRENRIVLYVNPTERWRTFWTIKHEVSHAIVDTLAPYAPAWLNEGLAENMESLAVKGNTFYQLPHSENFRVIQNAFGKGTAFDIKTILASRRRAYYAANASSHGRNQAGVGELVRMMLSTSTGQNFLTQVIHSYQSRELRLKFDVVEKLYIGGYAALESDWNLWLKRAKSTYFDL